MLVQIKKQEGNLCLITSAVEQDGTWVELSGLRPLSRERYIVNYSRPITKEYYVAPYDSEEKLLSEDSLKETMPRLYAYLSANKKALSDRKIKKVWYEINQPDGWQYVDSPKLLTSLGGTVGIDDTGGLAMKRGLRGAGIVATQKDISIYMILGILRSNAIQGYIDASAAKFGGKAAYAATVLNALSIPAFNEKTAPLYAQLDKLVREIVGLKKANPNADTSLLEKQVDSLVEKLYKVVAEAAKAVKEAA